MSTTVTCYINLIIVLYISAHVTPDNGVLTAPFGINSIEYVEIIRRLADIE